jgi:arylsulfatase A-like enzyme
MVTMKKNLIFILLDGARWDRLHVSKEFQDIQKEGTLLDNVNTAIPYTIGSVNATFSGLYGKENGIDAYYKMFRLKKSVKILPEILQDNGYYTACDLLTDKIIANRGFNVHQAHNEYEDDLTQRHPEFIKNSIKEANGKPIFLFLHSTRIHTITVSDVLKKYEWNNKEFYNQKKVNLENYDNVFLEIGIYVKKIKETLDKLNILNDSILIFCSDHGTGVGERFGERNYGSFTFEETIRSFYLFISKEINKGKKSSKLRETIDILPTLLDLLNIETDLKLPGDSISNYLINEDVEITDKEYVFSETGALHGPYPSPKEPNVFCIKNNNYKLIFLKTPNQWQLYNLQKDPLELNNIIGKETHIEDKMKKRLLEWINRN